MSGRNGGMRRPEEEKALLSEFAKMFHVAKANHKEQHNTKQSAAPPPTDKDKKKASKEAAKDARRGSKRRSAHGGSVWMVLKGGFSTPSVPLASNKKAVQRHANERACLSERRRVAALKEAEAYIESAWQQATESELVNSDGSPTEDGDAYLAEQYATAARMLAPAPSGLYLHQLVETHSSAAATAATTTEGSAAQLGAAPTYTLSRAEWEDICTREAAILFRYTTGLTAAAAAGATSAEEYFKAQQTAREALYHFVTAEPTTANGGDAAPTKCIVRIRDSQRHRHTTILSTAKAVNYFKSNIGQVLRKELAASKLPRGAADEAEAGNATTSQKTSNANTNGSTNAAHSSKKKRKR